jgi:hypothetical protein
MIPTPRQCPLCGISFPALHPKQVYCGLTCRRTAERQRARDRDPHGATAQEGRFLWTGTPASRQDEVDEAIGRARKEGGGRPLRFLSGLPPGLRLPEDTRLVAESHCVIVWVTPPADEEVVVGGVRIQT